MGLIDSHAHLTFPALYEQVEEVLDRCAEVGVERVITVGTDLSDARAAVELARRFPKQVCAATGFHPHEADKVTDDAMTEMARLWSDPTVVALGEMGLDYHYDFADRAVQRSVFARQLSLAASHDKPVVIHSREAMEDTIQLLVDHGMRNRRVVFHCFTGSAEEAARIAEQGWRLSFTGLVTFKNAGGLQEVARHYPDDQLMIETDAPYLSPEPVRSKRPNEPAHVTHIARFLADLRGVSLDQLADQTSRSTREFFALPS